MLDIIEAQGRQIKALAARIEKVEQETSRIIDLDATLEQRVLGLAGQVNELEDALFSQEAPPPKGSKFPPPRKVCPFCLGQEPDHKPGCSRDIPF